MKRAAAVLVLRGMLTGCFSAKPELERGMELRTRLLAASGCSFDADITADYGDRLYTFSVECLGDEKGDLSFTVRKPESISGITGSISDSKGKLTFDDAALDFPLLTDGLLNPVSAPWVFFKTLRSGYITSAGVESEQLHLSIDDSFEDDALHLDIWLNDEDLPVRAEILWDGQRYLSMDVNHFRLE